MKGVDSDITGVYSNYQLSREVSLEIATFKPLMAGPHWAAIEKVVREAVTHFGPDDVNQAHRHLSSASKFALWIWKVDAAVERFMSDGISPPGRTPLAPSTRNQIRKQLLHLTNSYSANSEHRREKTFARVPHGPYSGRQLAEFSSWAAMQPTPLRYSNAHALLGLAEGAGLTASEIANCLVRDVSVDALGAVVTIRGPKRRTVPVDESNVSTLLVAVEGRSPDDFVYQGNRNRQTPTTLVSGADWTGPERPTATRLRTTWIVERLNANAPPKLVLAMAGLANKSALSEYLPFVSLPDESQWRHLLSRRCR
jgi:hypothetical protein